MTVEQKSPEALGSYDYNAADDDELVPEQLADIPLGDDGVKSYLRHILKTPLLTAEQEVELAKRIEVGLFAQECLMGEGVEPDDSASMSELELLAEQGVMAKDQFVAANLRLVVSIAKRYSNKLPLLDLIQAGNEGLIRAVEKFDYAKGFKFSTYATWWIRQSLQRSVYGEGRSIRLPVHVGTQLDVIRTAIGQIESAGEVTSLEAIAASTGLSPERIEELLAIDLETDTRSLDQPLPGDSSYGRGTDRADFVAGPESADESVMDAVGQSGFAQLFATLDPDEQALLLGRKSLATIAAELGVGKSRVAAMRLDVLSKLRHPSVSWMLDGAPDWVQDALCAQVGRDLFFPDKGGSAQDAKRVCGKCAVRSQCLSSAIERSETAGIYGGVTPRGRRAMAAQDSDGDDIQAVV